MRHGLHGARAIRATAAVGVWVVGWTVGGYYHQERGDEPPPFELKEEEQVHLTALYDWLVEPSMAFLRRTCKEMSPTVDSALLTSLLGLLRCLLAAAIPGPHDANTEEGGNPRKKQLECCFCLLYTSPSPRD